MNLEMESIKNIISKGLNKSIDKMNRISSFKWELENIKFEVSKDNNDCVAIYLLSKDFNKIAFVLFIKKEDANKIFKIFSGYYPDLSDSYKNSYEIILREVGNIILNSVLGEFANLMRIAIIPDLPKVISGEKFFILENISRIIEENILKIPISSVIKVKGRDKIMDMELFFFVDNEIIRKI